MQEKLDLLIKNGSYPDFAAGEIKKGNIGISGGKITYIGDGEPDAGETLDAAGMVVSPGFIDIHMHEEDSKAEGEKYIIAEMMLGMGVTTAVGGNCGIQHQELSYFKDVIERLGGAPVNYIMQVGYNTLRQSIGVPQYEAASPEQCGELAELVRSELANGACGLSFGIEYDPGMTKEEILSVIEGVDSPDLIVSAHAREGSVDNIEPIRELVDISNKISAKFQISHLSSMGAYGLMQDCLDIINEAAEKNHKLNYDTYPYDAYSSYIGSAAFEDLHSMGISDYSSILLTNEPYKDMRCDKALYEKVRKEYPDMLAVVFAMKADEITAAIANPIGMIASDAIIFNANGHPRAAGTFPRVLGKYVREEKALSLADALRKMTLEPAKRLGLEKKGRIEEGCDADITIFDPDTIKDGATFTDLSIRPQGIEYVFIGGKKAADKDGIVNGRLGKFINYC